MAGRTSIGSSLRFVRVVCQPVCEGDSEKRVVGVSENIGGGFFARHSSVFQRAVLILSMP